MNRPYYIGYPCVSPVLDPPQPLKRGESDVAYAFCYPGAEGLRLCRIFTGNWYNLQPSTQSEIHLVANSHVQTETGKMNKTDN